MAKFQMKAAYYWDCGGERSFSIWQWDFGWLQIELLLKNQPFFIEVKFDGERMQLHKRGGEFRYFSRRLEMLISLCNAGKVVVINSDKSSSSDTVSYTK